MACGVCLVGFHPLLVALWVERPEVNPLYKNVKDVSVRFFLLVLLSHKIRRMQSRIQNNNILMKTVPISPHLKTFVTPILETPSLYYKLWTFMLVFNRFLICLLYATL